MIFEDFIKDEKLSDDRYTCYHLAIPVKIFSYFVDLEISIHCSYDLSIFLENINEYINWLKSCEQKLKDYYQEQKDYYQEQKDYYQKQLGDSVPDKWFEYLEVYHVSIKFNSHEDFGATISYGDLIWTNHTLAFDFEKYEVVGARLDG